MSGVFGAEHMAGGHGGGLPTFSGGSAVTAAHLTQQQSKMNNLPEKERTVVSEVKAHLEDTFNAVAFRMDTLGTALKKQMNNQEIQNSLTNVHQDNVASLEELRSVSRDVLCVREEMVALHDELEGVRGEVKALTRLVGSVQSMLSEMNQDAGNFGEKMEASVKQHFDQLSEKIDAHQNSLASEIQEAVAEAIAEALNEKQFQIQMPVTSEEL